MTKIKLCGLSRPCDIHMANELKPDYIGFVFAKKSKRYVEPEKAAQLKALLDPEIRAVGVFVDERFDLLCQITRKIIRHHSEVKIRRSGVRQLHHSVSDPVRTVLETEIQHGTLLCIKAEELFALCHLDTEIKHHP